MRGRRVGAAKNARSKAPCQPGWRAGGFKAYLGGIWGGYPLAVAFDLKFLQDFYAGVKCNNT